MTDRIGAEYLREILDYEPETGKFRWRVTRGRRAAVGDVAGSFDNRGYRRIKINNRPYREQRLAWLWMTGEWSQLEVDHIDGDQANNRWSNLRLATRSQNNSNQRIRKDNTTGYKGVQRHKSGFRVMCNGRHIGLFGNIGEARDAYCRAAKIYQGEFAKTGTAS